jgi:hypothetical protein
MAIEAVKANVTIKRTGNSKYFFISVSLLFKVQSLNLDEPIGETSDKNEEHEYCKKKEEKFT